MQIPFAKLDELSKALLDEALFCDQHAAVQDDAMTRVHWYSKANGMRHAAMLLSDALINHLKEQAK